MPLILAFRPVGLVCLMVVASLVGDVLRSSAAPAPPGIVERGRDAGWVKSHAWSGGVRHVFAEPENGAAGTLSLPRGVAFEFVFGCRADAISGKSYWRFRVGATPVGSGITAASEKAYSKAVKWFFGSQGLLVLLDASGRETNRLPMQPTDGGLETVALWDEVARAMLEASVIRVQGTVFLLESGTAGLKSSLEAHKAIKCKPWQ